jgi:hypothetical protein
LTISLSGLKPSDCYLLSVSSEQDVRMILYVKLRFWIVFYSICMVKCYVRPCKLTRKTHLLTDPNFEKSVIFDVTIPEEFRKAFLNLLLEKEGAEAQKEKAEALKEKAEAKKETADARLDTADAIKTLEKLSIENSLLAPRAVIEFIEIFVIAKAYNICGSREQKWKRSSGTLILGEIFSVAYRKRTHSGKKILKDLLGE